MSDIALIEKVARAICLADGENPDDEDWEVAEPMRFGLGDFVHGASRGPKWMQYGNMALRHIAATRAMAGD